MITATTGNAPIGGGTVEGALRMSFRLFIPVHDSDINLQLLVPVHGQYQLCRSSRNCIREDSPDPIQQPRDLRVCSNEGNIDILVVHRRVLLGDPGPGQAGSEASDNAANDTNKKCRTAQSVR